MGAVIFRGTRGDTRSRQSSVYRCQLTVDLHRFAARVIGTKERLGPRYSLDLACTCQLMRERLNLRFPLSALEVHFAPPCPTGSKTTNPRWCSAWRRWN